MNRRKGFTVIELLCTLLICATVLAMSSKTMLSIFEGHNRIERETTRLMGLNDFVLDIAVMQNRYSGDYSISELGNIVTFEFAGRTVSFDINDYVDDSSDVEIYAMSNMVEIYIGGELYCALK